MECTLREVDFVCVEKATEAAVQWERWRQKEMGRLIRLIPVPLVQAKKVGF